MDGLNPKGDRYVNIVRGAPPLLNSHTMDNTMHSVHTNTTYSIRYTCLPIIPTIYLLHTGQTPRHHTYFLQTFSSMSIARYMTFCTSDLTTKSPGAGDHCDCGPHLKYNRTITELSQTVAPALASHARPASELSSRKYGSTKMIRIRILRYLHVVDIQLQFVKVENMVSLALSSQYFILCQKE